jgi:hypothetical protein
MNDDTMNELVLRFRPPDIIYINPDNGDLVCVVSCDNVPSVLVSVVLSQN